LGRFNHVLKEEVLEDVKGNTELHACRKDPDQIEDDELKDDTLGNEAGGSIHVDTEKPLYRDSSGHMEDGVKNQFVKMEHKEHEDEVSKTVKTNLVHKPNISNSGQVGIVDGELRNVETHHVNNEDSTMEVTTNDDPN